MSSSLVITVRGLFAEQRPGARRQLYTRPMPKLGRARGAACVAKWDQRVETLFARQAAAIAAVAVHDLELDELGIAAMPLVLRS